MASTICVRLPPLRNATVRHYATAQAAAFTQRGPAWELEQQTLANKVLIASIDGSNMPISRVSIIFRGSSRNETYDTQGTAHHLRIAAGLTTKRTSCFGITRNIQQLGGSLHATTDRETTSYTLEVTRDHLQNALKYLEDVALHQVFKPWEVSDQLPRLRYELSIIPETARVMELLHKVAYRTGLGYSLYSPKRQLGKINTETLQHFVNTWFVQSRCSIVATGVSIADLASFGANLEIPSAKESQNKPAVFKGGEIRKERDSELATVAVAIEGASVTNEKDAIVFAILQRIIGSGPCTKWGSEVSSLHKNLDSVADKDPFALSAFNVSYSDSGLFGFVLSAPSNLAGKLTKSAHKWLKSPNLTDADLARGKAKLKVEVLSASQEFGLLHENLGQQIAIKGRFSPASAIIADIDNVSSADIMSAARRFATGKLSLAAIGNLSTVPYLDELE